MADGERRFFDLTGIFHLVLFISCVSSTLSSSDDLWYRIEGRPFSSSNNLVVRRLNHRHVRQAVDTPSTQPPSPDSAISGNGGQTLPDDANRTGSNSHTDAPNTTHVTPKSVTTHPDATVSGGGGGVAESNSTQSSNTTMAETTNTTTTAATSTTTTTVTTESATMDNPFINADIIHDYHDYYNTKAVKDEGNNYYVDISTAGKHETLSKNHRVAAVIPLKFNFPFYGHPVINVTVATGGFIYMSPFLHQWLTATQYIAPLMANFDPSLSATSNIFYLSEDEIFTVEWRDVLLQDQEDVGGFTFQTSLHSNGTISFVYKNIPLHADKISDENHPVKVGLSDAYYNDTYLQQFGIRRRTIYEYHQVVLEKGLVKTGAVIFIDPVPTCNTLSDCETCTAHVNVEFECLWCNTIGRCSDGLDWYRQHWDKYSCHKLGFDNITRCEAPISSSTTTTATPTPRSSTGTSTSTATEGTSTATSTSTTVLYTTTPIIISTTPTITKSLPASSTKLTPSPITVSTKTRATTPPTTTTSSKPVHEHTTTAKPSTKTTSKPTTSKPTTSKPTTSKPTTNKPTTNKPTTSKPTTNKPTTSKPTTSKATTNKPKTAKQPMTTTSTSTTFMQTEEATNEITDLNPNAMKSKRGGICDSTNQTMECAGLPPPTKHIVHPITPLEPEKKTCKGGKCGDGKDVPVAVIVVVLLLVLVLIGSVGGWVYYAYTHPTSKSGMWLIQHRPSKIKAKIQFWKSSSSSSDSGAKYRTETDA